MPAMKPAPLVVAVVALLLSAAPAYSSTNEAGLKFLAANGKKDGVVTTDSGLQYRVLESGDGWTPLPATQCDCHYQGSLIDGTVFDSRCDQKGCVLSVRVRVFAHQLALTGLTWLTSVCAAPATREGRRRRSPRTRSSEGGPKHCRS